MRQALAAKRPLTWHEEEMFRWSSRPPRFRPVAAPDQHANERLCAYPYQWSNVFTLTGTTNEFRVSTTSGSKLYRLSIPTP